MARKTIEQTATMPKAVVSSLKVDLALAIAHKGTDNQNLKDWAKRVLSTSH